MRCPDERTAEFYGLMERCQSLDPSHRPSFDDIVSVLSPELKDSDSDSDSDSDDDEAGSG